MRGQTTSRMQRLTLLGCLLSATCDQPPSANRVVCLPDQVLGTDASRQLLCVPAPHGKVAPPSCATALTSDGQQLLCTSRDESADKDQDASAALLQLDGAIKDIRAQLPPTTPGPAVSYVGLTMTPTAGRIISGPIWGLTAAADQCASQFGTGAHMCVMDELYQSVVRGTLDARSLIAPAWVYMPNWNTPAANPEEPLQGVADTCQDYTYPLGARNWRGMLVEWGLLPDGTPGFRWHGGTDAYCATTHPIACCK